MTNIEWNNGVEFLTNASEGSYIEYNDKMVIFRNMTAGNFCCYKNNEFIKLVDNVLDAMLFLNSH